MNSVRGPSDWIDSPAAANGRAHPSRHTNPATRSGCVAANKIPSGHASVPTRITARSLPDRVEHAPHVVDRVLERRERRLAVGKTLAPLVHHDQPGEARDPFDHLPIPRELLTHPDMADHPGHHEHIDRTVAVHRVRDVEAAAVGVTKSGFDHGHESRAPDEAHREAGPFEISLRCLAPIAERPNASVPAFFDAHGPAGPSRFSPVRQKNGGPVSRVVPVTIRFVVRWRVGCSQLRVRGRARSG